VSTSGYPSAHPLRHIPDLLSASLNSFEASFVDTAQKARWARELDAVVERLGG